MVAALSGQRFVERTGYRSSKVGSEMSRQLNVAVIGATGAVGDVFLRVAEERDLPIEGLKLLATSRSAGRQMEFRGDTYAVDETSEQALAGTDLVFCSATSEASRHWAPIAVGQGAVVIDDSSAFRMDSNVPVVVPEVNANDVEWHQGIISIPNCIILWMFCEYIYTN